MPLGVPGPSPPNNPPRRETLIVNIACLVPTLPRPFCVSLSATQN